MFSRVQDWSRRHETLVDTVGACLFLLLCLMGVLGRGGADHPSGLPMPAYLALTLGLVLPLTLRRRFPVAVFAVIASVAALQLVLGLGLLLADFGIVIGMYTVAAHCRPAWSLASLATVELGLLLGLARSPYTDWGDWEVFAVYTCLVLLCWVTGLYTNTRRSYLLGLEERAASLERERDARAQTAIAEERARIARELHDVVAHNVSVIVVQADGAAYTVGSDPGRARSALEAISETGRTALAEMRGILGVLRDGEPEDAYRPSPGLDQLEQLVEQMRQAGLPVELTVKGAAREVPAGVGLAVYRVVQEALTNTIKHAGPAVSRVRVWLYYGDASLDLRVLDDGDGTGAPDTTGEGHGLIGMRERVAAYGGSVRAQPYTDGGFEVLASLPLRPTSR